MLKTIKSSTTKNSLNIFTPHHRIRSCASLLDVSLNSRLQFHLLYFSGHTKPLWGLWVGSSLRNDRTTQLEPLIEIRKKDAKESSARLVQKSRGMKRFLGKMYNIESRTHCSGAHCCDNCIHSALCSGSVFNPRGEVEQMKELIEEGLLAHFPTQGRRFNYFLVLAFFLSRSSDFMSWARFTFCTQCGPFPFQLFFPRS